MKGLDSRVEANVLHHELQRRLSSPVVVFEAAQKIDRVVLKGREVADGLPPQGFEPSPVCGDREPQALFAERRHTLDADAFKQKHRARVVLPEWLKLFEVVHECLVELLGAQCEVIRAGRGDDLVMLSVVDESLPKGAHVWGGEGEPCGLRMTSVLNEEVGGFVEGGYGVERRA